MGARVAAAYLLFQLGPVVMTLERMGGSRHTKNPPPPSPALFFNSNIYLFSARLAYTARRIFFRARPCTYTYIHTYMIYIYMYFIFIFVGADAFCGAVPRAPMRVCM